MFLLALYGPTGSGKSAVAEAIAAETGALLISADAFQVYRGFDIGTNKPLPPHAWRLVDICDPHEGFGAGEFVNQALPLLQAAFDRGQSVVVAGGTGLYLRSLMEEYADMAGAPDPELRARLSQRLQFEGLAPLVSELLARDPETRVDLRNPIRVTRALERLESPQPVRFSLPPFAKVKVGLRIEQADLAPLLEKRLAEMIEAGWEDEARALLAQGVQSSAPAMKAIGYQALQSVVTGLLPRAEALARILVETRQYAKRQRAWMRSEPQLHWVGAPPVNGGVLQVQAEIVQKAIKTAGK